MLAHCYSTATASCSLPRFHRAPLPTIAFPSPQHSMRGPAPRPPPPWGPDEAEHSARGVGGSTTSTRKKGLGVRAWLSVDQSGQAGVVEAGKHAIMRRTGLPARDLRILDPVLSYPSTVLGREHAIVINLEHVKAIITAQEVLLLNARDPAVAPFVEELQRRLRQRQQSAEGNLNENATTEESFWLGCQSLNYSGDLQNPGNRENEDQRVTPAATSDGSKILPFEFIALEACLEAACRSLENESMTLEGEAHPALDKLTSKISTLNLEHVRQIKSRLVALTGRVQKVRDELEHLLDDDEDMAEMYLTDKSLRQGLYESLSPQSYNAQLDFADNECMFTGSGRGSGTYATSTISSNKHLDVQDLEMLLEAYFVQIDGTLNTLSALREYVDDTEDYINIMLDDKQNHLLQMGVMLTTATLIVSAFVVLVGIFGMNIQIDLFDEKKSGMNEFVWTIGGGATGSIILYVIAVSWCKHRRLLE